MGAVVTSYSKHGDIDSFIAANHAKKKQYREYRNAWKCNKCSLLFLLVETTSHCNLKCPMCIHSVGYDKVEKMTDEVFELVVQYIKDMRIPAVAMNQVNEPLLDKKIYERINKICRIDNVVDIHMNTNATLLDKKNGMRLLDSGLTRLLIGFDAFTKETYEKIRIGANYEQVIENILDFLELKEKKGKKFPVVRLSFVRTSENENEVGDWFQQWKDKVDYLSVQEYLTPVLDHTKNYLIPKSTKREKDINILTCKQPFERVTIRGDGTVLPCCSHFATKIPIGNIKENTLGKVWYGKSAKSIRSLFTRNTWMNHPVCSKCLMISSGIPF